MSALAKPVAFEIEDFLAQEQAKDLLRFTTAGSVDDGKSTLIGRLLYDSQSVYEDQLKAVTKASSGSRASRSTSLIATLRRRGASSSSPTPRGTSSTRATWPRAHPRPIWR
jgi:hypothetical protein